MSELAKTLPASWYCSQPLYELERRAVFLKAWYLLGPVTRFAKEDSIDYEMAQVQIRASKLPNGDFQVIRTSDNRKVPHHLTSTGLFFTALSEDAISFDDFFPNIESLLSRVDFTALPHKRSLSYTGRFNWKTMVDGYQECLHCQYTHRSFSVIYPPTFYAVNNFGRFSQHIADESKPDDGLFLYFFPNCTLNVYGGGMSCFRVCPTADPGVTRMEFDYYNSQDGEKFEEYFKFVRKVALEDYELCEGAQANLERGIYSQGVLNPEKETGVAHYQGLVREMVVERFKEEQREAGDAWRAGSEGVATATGRGGVMVR